MPKKAQARRTSRQASEESAKKPAASSSAASTPVERAETAPAARAPATSTWKSYYSLIPVALGLLASANSLWNGYAIDDITQVRNNALIRELKNIPSAFTNSVWSFASNEIVFTADRYFRPLFNVLLTINYAVFGTAPWGWHLANILIHAAATYLVFLVIDQVTGSKPASMITAGLFAVHPVHAESVAWVSGVTDPLMSLFALSAFYLYLRYKRSRNLVLLAGMLLLYLLGAMTKETALALPLLVAYMEVFHFEGSNGLGHRIIRAAAFVGLFAIPTLLYFLIRASALGSSGVGTATRYPLGPALATVPLAVAKYLGFMFLPWKYSYQHYTEFVHSPASFSFIGPVLLILALSAAIVWSRSRMLAFAAVWFVIWLAPALAAIPQFDPEYLVQERYLYLPSAGFCLAVALGIEWIAARGIFGLSSRRAAIAMSVGILVICGAAYVRQNAVWRDSLAVFEKCVAVDPASAQARTDLARQLFDSGKQKEAEQMATSALALDPGSPGIYLVLSYISNATGRLDQAIDYLEQGAASVREGPVTSHRLATLELNLGLLYERRKNFDRAEQTLLKSIEIWPRSVGWYTTGQFYLDVGRFEDARKMFEQSRGDLPGRFAPIHLKLGRSYDGLGQVAEAKAEYEKYLELAPAAKDRAEVMHRLAEL